MTSKLLSIFFSVIFFSGTVFAGGHEANSEVAETTAATLTMDNSRGTVLVAGATGGTGKLVVKYLVEEGFKVKAMARNAEKANNLLGDYFQAGAAELVIADVTDPDTLDAAVAGVDYVVSALGAQLKAEGKATAEFVDYKGTVSLIDKAKAADVKKFVLITSGGTTWWIHPLNWIGGSNVLKFKRKAEIHLRESGLTHVIFRPAGGLTDDPANQKPVVFSQNDGIPSSISREDCAIITVQALIHDSANNKTFEFKGKDSGKLVNDYNWPETFGQMIVNSDNF